MSKQRNWKIKDKTFIEENMHLTDDQLAEHFGCKKNTLVKWRLLQGIRRQEVWGKPKGVIPHNKGKRLEEWMSAEEVVKAKARLAACRPVARPMYTVYSVNHYKGLYIVTPESRKYSYGRYVYEQHHGIKLDKKYLIRYLDNNPANCDISNLSIETYVERYNRIRPSKEEAAELARAAHRRKRMENKKESTVYQFHNPYKLTA